MTRSRRSPIPNYLEQSPMSNGIVRVDLLKPRYRAIYLTPIILGLLGGVFVGMVATYYLIDLLEIATQTSGGKATGGLIYLSMLGVFFFASASVTVAIMILLRVISSRDGLLMLSGRDVPTDWYSY